MRPDHLTINERPIWIVEDNPDDEELTLRSLRVAGVTNPVIIDRDGEEAVTRIREFENSFLPLLVLLDLKLPKLNGLEVLSRIRNDNLLECIPIVVLTSSDEITDVQGCYTLGANAFVCKPVDYDQYITAVKVITAFWLRTNIPFSSG